MSPDANEPEIKQPEGNAPAGKGPGHIAGIVAGFLALIILNMAGKGDFIANRLVTGFVVGGGVYFIVALLVDVLTAAGRGR
jgi:hypothetical protein